MSASLVFVGTSMTPLSLGLIEIGESEVLPNTFMHRFSHVIDCTDQDQCDSPVSGHGTLQ